MPVPAVLVAEGLLMQVSVFLLFTLAKGHKQPDKYTWKHLYDQV